MQLREDTGLILGCTMFSETRWIEGLFLQGRPSERPFFLFVSRFGATFFLTAPGKHSSLFACFSLPLLRKSEGLIVDALLFLRIVYNASEKKQGFPETESLGKSWKSLENGLLKTAFR